jgi:hypothetical protein
MLHHIKNRILIFILAFCLVSCSKDDLMGEMGTALPNLAKQATVYSGYKRVKLSFIIDDASIKSCEIFWNNKAQSKKIELNNKIGATITAMIEGLSEGDHTFEIYTYGEGNLSSALLLKTRVYGDTYVNSLKSRTISDVDFMFERNPSITWGNATTSEYASNLTYTDRQDVTRDITVERTNNKTVLLDYKENTAITYRTTYVPQANMLDTFYTALRTVQTADYFSNVVSGIVKKSGMVDSILTHSFTRVSTGISYSSLRFLNKSRQPLSIYAMEADLSNPLVTMKAVMPNNRTSFNLQTVKDLAIEFQNPGQTTYAVTNADFFDWTPVAGVPWGPIFVNGVVIKDAAKNPGISYFAIKQDGKPAIGTFSDLPAASYPEYRDLVGGGVRLIINGNVRIYNDTEKHPRTIVGYTSDHMVYLIVVDGRQTNHSVGMTYDELSAVMKSLDVREAINLDGGGSTTMVLRKQNTFDIMNKHSDPTPRAVANGLAIVLKNP